MKSLTYIEIDISVCSLTYGVAPCTASIPTTGSIKCFNTIKTCQDRDHFSEFEVTLRFAKPTEYLPRDIDCIPSISDVSYTPATISLGENLGTRATLSVTLVDHPHSDTGPGFDKYLADRPYDPYRQGTFWGKFRARQPFLRGRSLRWITGLVGDDLADMEARHFVIDSFDGPTPDGKYTIVAKDILKLADGDRSQAPVLSNGFLLSDITASQTTATLSPSGIGNAEYPASGYVAIGGNEVVAFTRSGDALTITRAQFGSVAAAHRAQDRVQLCLVHFAARASDVIRNLLLNYAGVPASYIDTPAWQAEDDNFLGNLYTAAICEPTSVATLISELIEQAALAIWDDNVAQQIRFQVLRGVLTDAATFTPDNWIEKSLTLKEQPEKRLSQVQVYFGRIDSTKQLSNLDNYRSTSLSIDEEAEEDYGSPSIKTITSRWIPQGGRSIADRLGDIILGRFRDPPRRVTFSTMRYAGTDVELGRGYRVEAFCVQDETGAQDDIPIQVTRLNPGPDRFSVEAEEMLFRSAPVDPGTHTIILDANAYNLNLRSIHDTLYLAPTAGDVVNITIVAGVVIGSLSTAAPAVDLGLWPAGVTINLTVLGRIQGRGGQGAYGGDSGTLHFGTPQPGGTGSPGGTALATRNVAIHLDVSSGGQIWGGAGGGGGGGGDGLMSGGGGGGGSGTDPGAGGPGGLNGLGAAANGNSGSPTTGGLAAPGATFGTNFGGPGGNGGGPGSPGNGGGPGSGGIPGGPGGAAGVAIDGWSNVTLTLGSGDIRGPLVN